MKSIRNAAIRASALDEPAIFGSHGIACLLLRRAVLDHAAAATDQERMFCAGAVSACWVPFIKYHREAQA